ncbi:uncharacterized protein LOC110841630 isoform X1 [Folsomia candida]|uniref:Uncharacterized protein n=1 Tax=Folsomia candida TaxID=158441 RepID=A0A226F512_FOLCA|nr:uncharacterized protein LOC110841630 isoform X1 [Folsomia candida]OXA64271.1 hypothetical protein Fcan01_04007 [Folsomia candida]
MFRSLFAIFALVATCSPLSIVRKDVVAKSNNPFGTVDPVTSCGGIGNQIALRVSECEGSCTFEPGKIYNCEADFMPGSGSSSLSLWVEICRRNDCSIIVRTELPNSSVLPGLVYTVKYDIVPNDMFSGEIIEFRTYIYHTESYLMETCVSADVNIL